MIHFTTFFALVVGGMEVIQPAAAAVLAGLSPRINLGLMNTFQRRQGNSPSPPPQCESTCNPIQNIITSLETSSCTTAVCCKDSFETSFFNCFQCAETAAGVTNFTAAQALLDELVNECRVNGTQLPELTYPGQNPNRTLSSFVSSTPTVSSTTSLPAQSITQSTVGPSTSSTPTTTQASESSLSTATNVNTPTPTPTPTSSSLSSAGFRSAEKICFNLITVTIMLGTWLYFAAY